MYCRYTLLKTTAFILILGLLSGCFEQYDEIFISSNGDVSFQSVFEINDDSVSFEDIEKISDELTEKMIKDGWQAGRKNLELQRQAL